MNAPLLFRWLKWTSAVQIVIAIGYISPYNGLVKDTIIAAGHGHRLYLTTHARGLCATFSLQTIIYIEFFSSINSRPFIRLLFYWPRLKHASGRYGFCIKMCIVRRTIAGKHLTIARRKKRFKSISACRTVTPLGFVDLSTGHPSNTELCKWHRCCLHTWWSAARMMNYCGILW